MHPAVQGVCPLPTVQPVDELAFSKLPQRIQLLLNVLRRPEVSDTDRCAQLENGAPSFFRPFLLFGDNAGVIEVNGIHPTNLMGAIASGIDACMQPDDMFYPQRTDYLWATLIQFLSDAMELEAIAL